MTLGEFLGEVSVQKGDLVVFRVRCIDCTKDCNKEN